MRCYRKAFGIMAFVFVLSILCMFLFCPSNIKETKEKTVVATFYPVYVASLNIMDGAEGVTLQNLVSSQTGCLHDYQLSPENLITLSTADLWILNGGGAEGFLSEVMERYPNISSIDSSKGLQLIASEEDNPEEPYNSHFWTSPVLYKQQVENICDGLCKWDEQNASLYRNNTKIYLDKIDDVYSALVSSVEKLPTKNTILFHESLEYLAKDLALNPLYTLPVGEEGGVAASDLKEAADTIEKNQSVILLYDNQYIDLQYEYLASSAKWSRSLYLDIGVSKSKFGKDKDAWINAMNDTIKQFQEVSP